MFALLGTMVLGFAPAPKDADLPRPLRELQGTWRLIGGEEVGSKFGAEEAKKEEEVFVIRRDSLVIRDKGKIVVEATVTVDPDGRKGAINFKHKSGKYKDKTCHAIYTLEDDKLKICTASKMRADEPKDRPTVFSTEKQQEKVGDRPGKLLFILEREKGKR
jgi:uncharacterized protein (TIGR03067 family)